MRLGKRKEITWGINREVVVDLVVDWTTKSNTWEIAKETTTTTRRKNSLTWRRHGKGE